MDDWQYRVGLALCLCLVISVGSIIYFVWKDRLYKNLSSFFSRPRKQTDAENNLSASQDTTIEKIRASRFGGLGDIRRQPKNRSSESILVG